MFEDNGTKNSLKREEEIAVASKAFQAVFSKERVTVAGEVFINEVMSPWPIRRKDRLWSIAPGRMWAMACILQSWLVSRKSSSQTSGWKVPPPTAQNKTRETFSQDLYSKGQSLKQAQPGWSDRC